MIDAHVHCYAGVAPATFLASAARNFAAGAAAKGIRPAAGWLLFTETARDDAFNRFAAHDRLGDWALSPTEEPVALLARPTAPGLLPMLLIAGRQILTAEGLEVLAVAAPGPFADSGDLASVVADVRAAGGLAVLPWGFGKWWGRRGAVIEAFLDAAAPGTVFIGDNAGRPSLSSSPATFARAAAKSIWVLPGSDSLPLPAEADSTAGRYGFLLEGTVDTARPAAWLKAQLSGLRSQPESFGQLQGLVPFVHRQVAMQLRKRRTA